MHRYCPKDADTWCKYNKSLLDNEQYDHSSHFHLPEIIMNEIKPTFRDLCDRRLLEKCYKGKTQNPNESFNNTIWSVIPKRVFVTVPTLKYGVLSAVCTFNDGFRSKVEIIEHLGLRPGKNLVKAMEKLESSRLQEAEKRLKIWKRK